MRRVLAILAVAAVLVFGTIGASAEADDYCKSQLKKKNDSQGNTIYLAKPECSPYALGSYPGNVCFITVDRSAPVSPQPITVPRGTNVCVVLTNPRPTENPQFVPNCSSVAGPDVLNSLVSNLTPLQSLEFSNGPLLSKDFSALSQRYKATPDLGTKLESIEKWLSKAQDTIAAANAEATCFAQYNGIVDTSKRTIKFDGAPERSGVELCKTNWFKTSEIGKQDSETQIELQRMYTSIREASTLDLMQGQTAELDSLVKNKLDACSIDHPKKCDSDTANLKRRLMLAETIQSNLVTVQTTLQQVKLQMEMLPANLQPFYYYLPTTGTKQKGYTTCSISVVTLPLVAASSTSTPMSVATIPITFGANRWRTFTASTGIAFLPGKAANYGFQQQATAASNTNGTGSLCSGIAASSSGTPGTYCIVNSPSAPQVLFPAVYAHYLLPGLALRSAPFQFGLHLTGGAGLNLTTPTKSATFMIGPSLQVGTVMITPAVSASQDQRLKGNYSTTQLYTSSGTVPTDLAWKWRFSIGLSYIIPALSSASSASPASSPSASSGSGGSSGSSGGASSSGSGGKKGH